MINIAEVADERLSQTLRLMKHEIIKRGWSAELAYVGSAHCFIDRGDGKRLHVFSATPPTTSYAAASLANDKYATFEVLRSAGIPQLDSYLAGDSTPIEDQVAFMQAQGRVVVKPADGGHGKGITVNVTTPEQLEKAVASARAERKSIDAAIIQKQYLHDVIYDLRLSCINHEFVAATWRLPAHVIGDGARTVRELIIAENATERRGRPYYAELAEIDVEKAAEYLGDKIDTVPAAGEDVAVLGIANYGAGGETIDVTDMIPEWLKEIAVKASLACELPVAGVDFMIAAKPSAESTLEELDPALIEINKCPLLAMHDQPTAGIPRGAVSRYIDYLATI